MAALSASAERRRKEGVFVDYPVAASTTIYKGGLVADNGSGYLVAADDSGSYIFMGVAAEGADNSSGSAGDKNCRVVRTGTFEIPKSSAAAGDRGAKMYARSDNEVATSTTNSLYAGVCVDIVDSSTVRLDIAGATVAQ